MPPARSPNRDKAFRLWLDSGGKRNLKDIATELGVSPEQVRKWKHDDKWDAQTQTVTLPNGKGNVIKRKRGAPLGNKNAVGHSSSVPPGNKNGFKHGAYERIVVGLLPDDEREIFEDESAGSDVERELRQTLAALNAKEVRLLKRIAEIKGASKGTQLLRSIEKTHRELEIGNFDDDGRKKVLRHTFMGEDELENTTVTTTASVFDALSKLEAELDKVQGRKIKLLGQLDKMRVDRERLELERKRVEGESKKSKLAEAWIEALTGDDLDDDEGDDDDEEGD